MRALRGLISTWLEIAVNALLSLDQDDGRRVWVVLDELPTLHQVPSLQPGLAESRQFGGCFVLGVQVISALRDLYGRNGAETISGLCGTRVVLAAPDRDTAQWSADSLGRAEVEEVAEGFSYGANTIRDGVSLTPKRELRALALASEIMRLENLHGYLRFPGPLPVATIALDYVKRGQAAERFVPREGTPEAGPAAPAGGGGPGADAAPAAGPGIADGQGALALPPPETAPAPPGQPPPAGCAAGRGRHTAAGRPAPGRPGAGAKEHPCRRPESRRRKKRRRSRRSRREEDEGRRAPASRSDMVASIGAVASSAQGASYYERDGYYAKDDPEHLRLSAWAGRGAAELGLEGAVDPDTFKAVLEGKVPDGSGRQLGRRGKDGEIQHRPGRDLTLSAPKSVSLAALVGGDARVTEAHDRAVARTLAWFEKNVAETRMKDPETGRMARTGDQKTVIATFRHDTSRNLDPALHTHAVIANMVQGEDGKWRSMANERLYESKMLLGALYRSELAQGLCAARIRDREDPCRRALRDRRRLARSRRGVLVPARRDRGGGGRARRRRDRRRPAPRPARGADDPRGQARHRPGRAARELGETGRRARLRCAGARRGGGPIGRKGRGPGAAGECRRSRPRSGRVRKRHAGPAGCRNGWRRDRASRSGNARARIEGGRRRSTGRWRICPNARRCSPAPACSPPRSLSTRPGCASPTSSASWRRARRRERCTRRACRAPRGCSPPTARWPTRRRPSR